MCGPNSALGLAEQERALWPVLRERLRVPGRLMGLMRGVLGGDAEVGVVVATTPTGIAVPLAILVTPSIAAEITFDGDGPEGRTDVRRGWIGDDPVEVLVGEVDGAEPAPLAIMVTGWMREHLFLYSRELWHRRRR